MPALWTPELLGAGLKFFLYAPDIAQEDASLVPTWTGRVNSKNAANATEAEQPTYQTSEINGLAVVRSDGSDDDLVITSHGLTQPCTVLWLGKVTGGNGSGRMFQASNLIGRRSTNDFLMNAGSSVTYSTGGYDANTHVHVLTFNGAASRGSFDGTAVTGDAGTGTPSANMVLFSTGSATFAACDCLAVLGYAGTLGGDDLARLEGWAAHVAGIEANLPAAHAFKNGPPLEGVKTGLGYPLGGGLRQRTLG